MFEQWAQRHRSLLIAALTCAIFILLIWGAARRDLVSLSFLSVNKDAIGAISDLFTLAAVVLASLFSYYKFFAGRTFSHRAELSIAVDLIPAPDGRIFHAATLTVKNIGTLPIWNPLPTVVITATTAQASRTYEIENWIQESDPDGVVRRGVIDAGEAVSFFVRQFVPADVWVVTYIASVKSDRGDIWTIGKSVANSAAADRPS